MTARRFFGWTSFLLAILIGCAAWGMLSVLAARPGLAPIYDLSPQQQLTLSPDTRELLASVRGGQTRLEFHTFFEPLGGARPTSEGMQKVLQIRTTIQSLTRDLLWLYERLGGDSVTVTHHDLLREVETTREAAQDFALSKINTLVVRYGRRSKVLSLDDDLARIDIPGRGTPTPGGRPALHAGIVAMIGHAHRVGRYVLINKRRGRIPLELQVHTFGFLYVGALFNPRNLLDHADFHDVNQPLRNSLGRFHIQHRTGHLSRCIQFHRRTLSLDSEAHPVFFFRLPYSVFRAGASPPTYPVYPVKLASPSRRARGSSPLQPDHH